MSSNQTRWISGSNVTFFCLKSFYFFIFTKSELSRDYLQSAVLMSEASVSLLHVALNVPQTRGSLCVRPESRCPPVIKTFCLHTQILNTTQMMALLCVTCIFSVSVWVGVFLLLFNTLKPYVGVGEVVRSQRSKCGWVCCPLLCFHARTMNM